MSNPNKTSSKRGIRTKIILAGIFLPLLWEIYLLNTHQVHLPFCFVIQSQKEHCLEANLMLLIESKSPIERNRWVAFKPFGALSYVETPYVIKVVAGVPGDYLLVQNGNVWVNDQQVSAGMPDAPLFHQAVRDFDKSETIPEHHFFVTATHPLSMDSRYWGYLKEEQIVGHVYRLF